MTEANKWLTAQTEPTLFSVAFSQMLIFSSLLRLSVVPVPQNQYANGFVVLWGSFSAETSQTIHIRFLPPSPRGTDSPISAVTSNVVAQRSTAQHNTPLLSSFTAYIHLSICGTWFLFFFYSLGLHENKMVLQKFLKESLKVKGVLPENWKGMEQNISMYSWYNQNSLEKKSKKKKVPQRFLKGSWSS